MDSVNNAINIKQEEPVEFICILKPFKPYSTFEDVKTEVEETYNQYNDSEPRKFECKICLKKFKKAQQLKFHSKTHAERVTCTICSENFSAAAIKGHLRLHNIKQQAPKFQCKLCEKKFHIKHYLKRHILSHGKLFECDLCGGRFGVKSSVKVHLKNHISPRIFEVPKLECTICCKKLKSRLSLKLHAMTHGERWKCPICFRLYSHHSKKDHLQTHDARKLQLQFACDICSRKFTTKKKLHSHSKTHRKIFGCDFCGHHFAFKSDLAEHLKIHFNREAIRCKICDKKILTEKYLRMHIKRVHAGKVYQCDSCPKVYTRKKTIIAHLNLHKAAFVPKPKVFLPCKCSKCPFTSKTSQELTKHRTEAHLKKRCNVCEKKLSTQKAFDNHMMIHNKPEAMYCKICDKTFQNYIVAKLHHEKHQNKSTTCAFCSKKFLCKSKLLNHIEIVHQNIRRFSCDFCGKKLTSKAAVSQHVLTHLKEHDKPFKCEHCKKSFIDKYTLRNHNLRHDKENPFFCRVCQKTFLSKHYFKTHMKLYHSKTNEIFKCDKCTYESESLSNFKNHERIHQKNVVCKICDKKFTYLYRLKTHMKSHVEPKDLVCHCNRKFVSVNALKNHKTRTHGESRDAYKPFKCNKCSYAASKKGALNDHHKTHTKLFTCDKCGQRCANKTTVRKHLQSHLKNKNFKQK